MINTRQSSKTLIFSYNSKTKDEIERAYIVTSKESLNRFNYIFGLDEHEYPAIYVDMFGMMTISDIGHEQFLRNVGYEIITI